MFLRCSKRHKDGKEHFYWSVVENRRLCGQRVVQRHMLYLGELNGVQQSSWRKPVELFGQDDDAPRQVALLPEEHAAASVTLPTESMIRTHAVRWRSLFRPSQLLPGFMWGRP